MSDVFEKTSPPVTEYDDSSAKPSVTASESSGRYRLLTVHIIAGGSRAAGTEVGTGTDIPYPGLPSNQMEGVDDEGKRRVNELHQKLYGQDAPWHNPDHPLALAREQDREALEAAKAEGESEPVSHQQAWERGAERYRDDTVVAPNFRAPPAPISIAGDTSIPLGPATPLQDPMDPRVQVRSPTPQVDSLPKIR